MERDNGNGNTTGLPALAIFRGLYNRVADKLGVDPSYVSRVARGERRSAAIVAALEEEMAVIREHLNNHLDGKSRLNGNSNHDGVNHDGAGHDGKLPVDGAAKLDGNLKHDGASLSDGARAAKKSSGKRPKPSASAN